MRAPTRESTRERMIRIMALVLVISIGFLVPKAAAQSDKYSKMGGWPRLRAGAESMNHRHWGCPILGEAKGG
jgi:hypothetical protein